MSGLQWYKQPAQKNSEKINIVGIVQKFKTEKIDREFGPREIQNVDFCLASKSFPSTSQKSC